MNTHTHPSSRRVAAAATLTLLLGLSACSGMSQRDKNTAIGAGVGAIGNQVDTDKK